jgi:hypothetical protein
MRSANKMNHIQNEFDFTAIRIFFSVIAIILSVSMPSAMALKETSIPFQMPILSKFFPDFMNQNDHSFLQSNDKKISCGGDDSHFVAIRPTSNGMKTTSDFSCPINKENHESDGS